MAETDLKAFSDVNLEYYELTKPLAGILPKGAVFVHDPNDTVYGSLGEGCLKLCWTPNGNIYYGEDEGICGGSVILHYAFAKSSLFKKISKERVIFRKMVYEIAEVIHNENIDKIDKKIEELEKLYIKAKHKK